MTVKRISEINIYCLHNATVELMENVIDRVQPSVVIGAEGSWRSKIM